MRIALVVPTGRTQPWLTAIRLEKQGSTARTLRHAPGGVVVGRVVVRVDYVEIAD